MQIGILEPKNFSLKALLALKKIGYISLYKGGNLSDFLAPLDALFVRLGYTIDKKLLRYSPRLKWLCSPTTGHNHLDEGELTKRGIQILSLRGEKKFMKSIRATPEHALGLIIALLRRYRQAFEDCGAGKWDRDACLGEEINEKHVGIIGLGRVGHRLAMYLQGMGAKVNWYDPNNVSFSEKWARCFSIQALIAESKIIVLCASHLSGQSPILGLEEIKAMEGRYFVNVARGELVDEEALLNAVRLNSLAGVAVDVLESEITNNRLKNWRALMHEHNLLITPHIGGATIESMEKTELRIADKLSKAAKII